MDHPADISALLDSLTAQTSAERFGQVLAEPPTPFPTTSTLPVGPAFDMPLVAAHHSSPDPLSPSALLPNGALDLAAVFPCNQDYTLPVSAVTGASSYSDSASHSPQLPIRKKRARSNPKPKTEHLLALAHLPTASDVSSLSPRCPTPAPSERHTKPEPIIPTPPKTPRSQSGTSLHIAPPTSSTHPQPSAQPKSHTRKCREKVTKQFENLLEVLPRPPSGVEVKHKAQILEFAIATFRDLLLRRTSLQSEIALASKPALRQWMDVTIAAATAALPLDARTPVPLSAILEPFVGLYCVKKGWTYGEMWLVNDNSHASLASCLFNTDDDAVLKKLDNFATISRSQYTVPAQTKSGIVHRVIASKRSEWLNEISSDDSVFDRAHLAGKHGLCVGEAVPVMLDKNRCAAVLFFADVAPHTFSTADMIKLLDYASTLGSLYMEYLSHSEKRAYVQRQHEPKLEAKPIHIADAGSRSPDRTSASNLNLAFSQGKQSMPSMIPLHGFLPPSSETSTSFFGEAGFIGRS